MEKVFFLTGARPPQTGGELYNHQLSQYLGKLGWQQECVSLHERKKYLRLSKIPIIGNILISLIFAVFFLKNRGILVEDHYFTKYLLLTNFIHSFFLGSKIVILVHLFYNYDSNDKFMIRKFINRAIEKKTIIFC